MEYGLIGEKLGHSYSKVIHEKLADYTYDICPLTKEEFKDFMEKKDFTAINVTIPYKKDVIPYLTHIDDHAKAIGAVNTIVNKGGELYGYNTDYAGFDYMLKKHSIYVGGKKCIVLGNGGAAQAVIAVLKMRKAKEIILVSPFDEPGVIDYEECFKNHSDADIVINTSPVGMFPNVDASPVDLGKFPKCSAAVDIVYNPIETRFTAQGRALGMTAVTGLEMLVAQALYAVEIFKDTKLDEAQIDVIYQEVKEML